jgi:hypothetical protein
MEEIEEIKNTIILMFSIVYKLSLNIDFLNNELEKMKGALSSYEAIGILDRNPLYFKNVEDKKARVKRLKSLIDLINTLIETNDKIIRNEGLKEI